MRAWIRVIVASLCLSGCAQGARATREAQLSLVVRNDGDEPLAGVVVDVDDQKVAVTDEHGRAKAVIQANEATRVTLGVRCPEGYRQLPPRSVALRARDATPLELAMVCRPLVRTLAVVIRAPGAEGLPVRADGEPLGRIGSDGTLHAIVRRAPDSELRLAVDTAEAPLLEPQNAAVVIPVHDRDDVVTFDQAFTRTKPKKPRRVSRPAPSAPVHVPYAIGRAFE